MPVTPRGCPVTENDLVDVANLPRALQWLLAIAVVLISGFFAGMTLGIMGLDKVGLQILATAGDSEKERRHAKALIPVREKGNWLLCTLLIANTIANTFLPILIASFAGGIYGFVGSTILILVLAEIAPQAICSRYGLLQAARMIYVIYFFMALLAPIAWPVSWILDKILGREVGTIYSRAELKHLITIHVENPEHQEESGLTREDYKVISDALDIRDKRVRDVMTRVDKVFTLDASTRLNFDEMLTIYKSGYTRIPVYEGHRQNIIGILYTKDLILVDPDDEVEVRAIIALQGCAGGNPGGIGSDGVQYILDVTPLNEVFKLFKTCGTHLMVACKLKTSVKEFRAFGPGDAVLKGLVKQAEVIDAGGAGAAAGEGLVVRGERSVEGDASDAAMAAAAAAGASAVSPSPSSPSPIKTLMANAAAAARAAAAASSSSSSSSAPSARAPPAPSPFDVRHGEVQLYARGVRSCHLTLVLQGRVCVRAGSEGFESELGPWSHLGAKALSASAEEPYVPYFDAVALPPCRVLRIHADAYRVALRVGEANAVAAGRAVRRALSETAAQRAQSGLGQSRRSHVARTAAAAAAASASAGGGGGGGGGTESEGAAAAAAAGRAAAPRDPPPPPATGGGSVEMSPVEPAAAAKKDDGQVEK